MAQIPSRSPYRLHERLAADTDVGLDEESLAACFSTDRFLRNSAIVFERLEALEL